MSRDTGGPAFPGGNAYPEMHCKENSVEPGMTLRDYFAAKAMQALVARADLEALSLPAMEARDLARSEWVAIQAYRFADGMLSERAKCSTP